jgi:hypothetical protein
MVAEAIIPSVCIREPEFPRRALAGYVLELAPRASVHSRNRGRWADHGPIESRTLDVGVEQICTYARLKGHTAPTNHICDQRCSFNLQRGKPSSST